MGQLRILSTVLNSVLNFFYPSFCLHCEIELNKTGQYLCRDCFALIEFIPARLRCSFCYAPKHDRRCFHIKDHHSVFEGQGPILDLYNAYISTNRTKIIASLIFTYLANIPNFSINTIIPMDGELLFFKLLPEYRLLKELNLFFGSRLSKVGPGIREKKSLFSPLFYKELKMYFISQKELNFMILKVFVLSL